MIQSFSGRRLHRLRPFLLLLLCDAAPAQVTLEYVAHACFVVQSPGGTRVAIDPYNGYRWLGYSFPEGLKAQAVLVTHPHYDHDASYYFGPEVPVFRSPGEYSVGDIRLRGVAGRHADPYGAEFGQTNTLWVVETGCLRIAHLGDTGPLTPAMVAGLGRVDIVMLPVDGQEHILKNAEVEAIRAALRPGVTIPMHYQIPELSDLPKDLGPMTLRGARRLGSHRAVATVPRRPEVWVFSHSPEVRPWSASLRAARAAWEEARRLPQAEAAARLRKSVELAPGVSLFSLELARSLKQPEEAIRVLERALAAAGRTDNEYTIHMRSLLADLYAASGNSALAELQHRLIRAASPWIEPRQRAERFLAGLDAKP